MVVSKIEVYEIYGRRITGSKIIWKLYGEKNTLEEAIDYADNWVRVEYNCPVRVSKTTKYRELIAEFPSISQSVRKNG